MTAPLLANLLGDPYVAPPPGGNDLFADATPVVIAVDGEIYTDTVGTDGYTFEDGVTTGDFADWDGYTLSAWWSYTPITSGIATIKVRNGKDAAELILWSGDAVAALTLVGYAYDGFPTDVAVTGGVTYHLSAMTYHLAPAADHYALEVSGPATQLVTEPFPPAAVVEVLTPPPVLTVDTSQVVPAAADVEVTAPAALFEVLVSVPAPVSAVEIAALAPGVPVIVAGPAALVEVRAPAPLLEGQLLVTAPAPAQVEVTAIAVSLIDALVSLESPWNGQVIPSTRPTYAAAVTTSDPAAMLAVEYADNAEFADAVTLTVAVLVGLNRMRVTVRASADMLDGVYFWRARLTNTFSATDWTPAKTFTVSALDGTAVGSGSWTVSAVAVGVSQLWFLRPARGVEGDAVHAVGWGMGGAPITATVAGIPATVTYADVIAPTADAYTADRVIDPDTGVADPGHQLVVLTVPAVPAPGGVVVIEGS